jgi:hypothetical protein
MCEYLQNGTGANIRNIELAYFTTLHKECEVFCKHDLLDVVV